MEGASDEPQYFYLYDVFHAVFKDGVTLEEIEALNQRYGLEVAEVSKYGRYAFKVPEHSGLNALELANVYHRSALTVWASPDFYHTPQAFSGRARLDDNPVAPPEDEFFDLQWHLNDQPNQGGPEVDINALEAWKLTTGDRNLVVAVLDEGVEQHEDFYPDQLVAGTTAGGGDGSPASSGESGVRLDEHGQAVAGLIAAAHNSLGVRGVTDGAKIMSVRTRSDEPDFSPTIAQVADVIDYAWENEADVLNWSGGYPAQQFYDQRIVDALDRARALGRNGKGCVVIAAAGNSGTYVAFPARLPNVLAVGAVTDRGERASYSAASTYIDVVAPSSPDGDQPGQFVTTIDRMGADEGYPAFDPSYYSNFRETSAAAPQVAGIAALVLSIYPDFEESVVRDIILSTANEIAPPPAGVWNGEGLVDAYEAVVEAIRRAPNATVIESDDQINNLALNGEDLWVLPGVTLTLTGLAGLNQSNGRPSQINVAGTLVIAPGSKVLGEEGAEIVAKPGGCVQNNGSVQVDRVNWCIMAEPGGLVAIGAGGTLDVSGGGLLASKGGTYVVEDGATINYHGDATAPIIKPGTTFKMGRNARLRFHRRVEDGATINYHGDATAPIIKPGTTFKMGRNARLRFHRRVDLYGSGTAGRVRFEPAGNPSSSAEQWGYVLVRGDHSYFRHVDFTGGRWTLRVEARNVTVRDCNFRDNHSNNSITLGPTPSGGRSRLNVYNVTFQNRNQGLSINGGDAYLWDNSFTDLDGSAVSPYYGTVQEMRRNYISGTTTSRTWEGAVDVRQGGEAYLGYSRSGPYGPYAYYGQNTIRRNGGREVAVWSGGRLYAGTQEGAGGRNNIYDTDGQSGYYHSYLHNESAYNVDASQNYWGGYPSGKYFHGTVYVYPYLSSFVSGAPTVPRIEAAQMELAAREATFHAKTGEAELAAQEAALYASPAGEDGFASADSLGGNGPEGGKEAKKKRRAALRKELKRLRKALADSAGHAKGARLAARLYYLHRQSSADPEAEERTAEDDRSETETRALLKRLAKEAKAHPAVAERAALAHIDEALQTGDAPEAAKRLAQHAKRIKSLEGKLELAHARVAEAMFSRQPEKALKALAKARALEIERGTPKDELASYDALAEEIRTFGGEDLGGGAEEATAHVDGGASDAGAVAEAELETVSDSPAEYALEAAYPNPFNPQATIRFALPEASDVRLVVYDVTGREVARLVEGQLAAGRHEARFDGSRLASGMYLYRLTATGAAERFAKTGRMMLVK